MNVSNQLKKKVINHEKLNKEEVELFLKYMIDKTLTITNNMYNRENYNPMFLFYEICYSYNLTTNPFNNNSSNYSIININNKKYLIDITFNDNRIPELKKNKYIEYTENKYIEYLNIIRKSDINE